MIGQSAMVYCAGKPSLRKKKQNWNGCIENIKMGKLRSMALNIKFIRQF